tara:strand:+ start:842 stop:1636 length:795 start_codon:yes stop_codon:yes gene_type:complete
LDYIKPSDAKGLRGLRLVLTIGVPGPWGESAKKMFEYKDIDYVSVEQHPAEPNEDLVAWTGVRNAPIAVYNDEAPKTNFQDIVALAERFNPEQSLTPEGWDERITCFGISNEICGEGGFGWSRRLMARSSLRKRSLSQRETEILSTAPNLDKDTMSRAYGASESQSLKASERVLEILIGLGNRIKEQKAAGSSYFVGDRLTSCDIHWACFSNMLLPLPERVNPMPEWLRLSYADIGFIKLSDFEELLEHRDMVFEKHLKLPLDF